MKIVSDGIKHQLLDDNGLEVKNVVSINIHPLKYGAVATATITIINLQLELELDPQFIEGKL